MTTTFESKLGAKVPQSVYVYQLKSPRVDGASVIAAARKLGLSGKGGDTLVSEEWVTYSEGRHAVSVNRKSGAMRYRHVDRYGEESEQPFELGDAASRKIALEFLKRHDVVPVEGAAFHKVTHLRSGVGDVRGGKREEKLLDAGVIYRRTVDGMTVEGPGGFAMVNIAPDKAVVGLQCVWRPIQKRLARVKLIPPGDALEAMERVGKKMLGDTVITKAAFGYFELGEIDRQVYLQPAYAFIYVVRNGEVAHKSIEVIPAGEKSYEKLMGKKRFPGPARPALRKSPGKGRDEER